MFDRGGEIMFLRWLQLKVLIIFLILINPSVFASLGINKFSHFSIIRNGGGDIWVIVSNETNNSISAYIKSCNFKELSKENQLKSKFKIIGVNAQIVEDILNNNGKVIIASEQQLSDLATGTWLKLKLYTKNEKSSKKEISSPIIIINSKVSNILKEIEEQALNKNREICAQ